MFEERPKSSPANFTLYPLALLAVCFALGILAAKFLAFNWQIYFFVCIVFAFAAAFSLKKSFAVIFLCAAFFAVGGLYFSVENRPLAANRLKRLYDEGRIKSGDPIEIEGVLKGKPELAAGGFFLEIDARRAIYKGAESSASGKIRLFAATDSDGAAGEYERLGLRLGATVRAACRLRREENFLNAGVSSLKEILDNADIDATANLKSPLLIEKISDAPGFSPLARIYDWRDALIVGFRDNFNVSTKGVLIASLLGDKHFLDKRAAEVFREGGTFHVLVISGLHITFIGGLWLFFVGLFTQKRLPRFLIVCAFLWAYAFAVGANVPVVRAASMFTILLFSRVVYRQGTLLNSLGACALLLLVWRPNDFFSQSFQLTFVSVAALVVAAFPLLERLRAVGVWTLSAEAPAPPRAPVWLVRFCETIYWRDAAWKIESGRNVWSANLFKSPYINWSPHSRAQTISRYIFEGVLVSAIVQICLLPLMAVYFHRVSFAGILLNLWVGVVIALESFTAIFAVCLAHINHSLAFPFIKITEFFNRLLVAFPRLFTENSWASFRVPAYSAGAPKSIYILYFLPVLAAAFLLYRWNPFALESKIRDSKYKIQTLRASLFCLLIFAGLIVFHPGSAPAPDGRLHVDFLDVGQGDSALLTFPGGETMLVDGGGKRSSAQMIRREDGEDGEDGEPEIFEPDAPSIGEAVVSNFLWSKGYDAVDYILATHADADHIQGLRDAAKNFSVRAALFGRTPLQNQEFAAVYEILEKRGVPVVKLARGDVLDFDGVKIEVLSPEKADAPDAPSDNNRSVVLRLSFGARRILLTGDIEKETERELLNAPESVRADIVKVAHHGSLTSSVEEFVRATRAKLAVISVGRESPFGHPRAEVVERWKNAGARVLTTGENGTISISTDGRDLQLKTFEGEVIYR